MRQNFINGYVFEFSMFMKVINEYGHGFASITLKMIFLLEIFLSNLHTLVNLNVEMLYL